ncbi:hypothetical protein GWO43_30225 [candidate division KSB1 bacterium]|nr:hypothetical protein [candidate division KSB1 bacterium]NIV70635.1 hypothetical protein [Phycisphaerae bacterium]NIS28168.1 hypothetical protein [candidate division KSB1 bacterium]NIT75060.1 hypothetical protein [candidate division KSB1 bacterium]NIU28846.1 hypothetical protein [candidate division KSB1 bacterium]
MKLFSENCHPEPNRPYLLYDKYLKKPKWITDIWSEDEGFKGREGLPWCYPEDAVCQRDELASLIGEIRGPFYREYNHKQVDKDIIEIKNRAAAILNEEWGTKIEKTQNKISQVMIRDTATLENLQGKEIPLAQAQALIEDRAVIVPKEPTEEMVKVGGKELYEGEIRLVPQRTLAKHVYKAMIQALTKEKQDER